MPGYLRKGEHQTRIANFSSSILTRGSFFLLILVWFHIRKSIILPILCVSKNSEWSKFKMHHDDFPLVSGGYLHTLYSYWQQRNTTVCSYKHEISESIGPLWGELWLAERHHVTTPTWHIGVTWVWSRVPSQPITARPIGGPRPSPTLTASTASTAYIPESPDYNVKIP